MSVRDLHEKAEKQCLEEGGMSEDVPSLSTLYLRLVPSNEWNAAASRCFGWIPVKIGMTKSSGRAFGPDSHHNEKLWQHVMWKSIEVRRILKGIAERSMEKTADHSIEIKRSSALFNSDYRIGIGMVGKDDKTNISVARWGLATKAVARQSYTAIEPKYQDLFSADHDFSTIDKITPTVHAYPNPTKYLTESL